MAIGNSGTALDFTGGQFGQGAFLPNMFGSQGGKQNSNFLDNLGMGAGIGGLATGLMGNLFSKPDYSGVQQQLGKLPGQIKPYYEPYIQAGEQSLGSLQDQISQLIQNPSDFLNQLGSGYTASPGYKFNVDQATEGANRAAAAGGQLGSPAEQASLARQIHGIGQQDYENYLNHALGAYGQGFQGLSNLTGLGAQEGSSLAENLASIGLSQADLEKSRMQSEQASDAGLAGMFGSAMSILPFLL